MAVVNGRKSGDAYTCVPGKGCSVENEKFSMIWSFKGTTMSESVKGMGSKRVVTRVLDHSLLSWEIGVDLCW